MAMRTLVVVALAFAPVLAHSQDLKVAPPDAPSRVTIARAPEPGTSLTVSGRVVDPEGRPVAGVSIYAYQTDAKGEYIPGQSGGSDNPRLFGYMRSDAEGRYAFVTIKPGSYPNSRNPAHIHFEVVAPTAGRAATRSCSRAIPSSPISSRRWHGRRTAMWRLSPRSPRRTAAWRSCTTCGSARSHRDHTKTRVAVEPRDIEQPGSSPRAARPTPHALDRRTASSHTPIHN